MRTQVTHTLATLYLAYVLASPHITGPFGVFKSARETLPHGGLLTCFFCLVFWCALTLRILPRSIVETAAIAGGASVMYKYSGLSYGN